LHDILIPPTVWGARDKLTGAFHHVDIALYCRSNGDRACFASQDIKLKSLVGALRIKTRLIGEYSAHIK
jgi:hypothetical protein